MNIFVCSPYFQSGFRLFHCVETVLYKACDNLNCNKAEGKYSTLVLFDLSTAFDTVFHDTLLCDLEILSLTGLALSWFRIYLTTRKINVIIDDKNLKQTTCSRNYLKVQSEVLYHSLF